MVNRFNREAAREAVVTHVCATIDDHRDTRLTLGVLLDVIHVVWNSQAEPSPAAVPAPLEPGTPAAIREAVRLIAGRYVIPDATGQWWELSSPHHFAMSSTPLSKAADELLRHLNVVDPLTRPAGNGG